jgi:hypothetical protein
MLDRNRHQRARAPTEMEREDWTAKPLVRAIKQSVYLVRFNWTYRRAIALDLNFISCYPQYNQRNGRIVTELPS